MYMYIQCTKFHISFLYSQIGFSFGGMLASCVSARLWQNATADQTFLLQHVVCITFGQPFLEIKMVQEEIQICPQFEQSIHSIFYKDDVVPLMLSYLHVDESKLPNVSSPVSYPKAKVLMGPSDSVAAPKVSAQPKLVYISFMCISHGHDFISYVHYVLYVCDACLSYFAYRIGDLNVAN